MTDKKFFKLFLTLVLSVFIVLLLYTGLHFILVNLLGLGIKEMWIDYWGTVLTTILVAIFVINKRLKALNLSEKAHDFLIWYYIPITIVLPTMFAKKGLRDYKSTFKSVDNVYQIKARDTETYYKINSFFIDKRIRGLWKSNETIKRINLYHHYVYPIFKDSLDKQMPYVWYGLKFQDDIAPLDPDKNELMNEFEVETEKKEKLNDFYRTKLFKREILNSDADRFQSAIDLFEWSRQNKNIILTPIDESYEEIQEGSFNTTITILVVVTLVGLVTSLIIFPD